MGLKKKVEAHFEHTWKYTHEELVDVVESNKKTLVSSPFFVPEILGLLCGIAITPKNRDGDDTNDYFGVALVVSKHNDIFLNVKWSFVISGCETCLYDDHVQSFPYISFKRLGEHKEVFWKNTQNYFVNGIFTLTVKGTFSIELPEEEGIEYELVRQPFSFTWKIPEGDFIQAYQKHGHVKTKVFRSSTILGFWYTFQFLPRGGEDEDNHDGRAVLSIELDIAFENLVILYLTSSVSSMVSIFSSNTSCSFSCPLGMKFELNDMRFRDGVYEIACNGVFTEYRPKNSTRYDVIEYPFCIAGVFSEKEIRKAAIDNDACESDSVASEIIPNLKYSILVEPSDENNEAWIFLDIENNDELKIEVDAVVEIMTADFSVQTYETSEEDHHNSIYCCKTEELFDPRKRFLADRKLKVQIKGAFYWYKPCDPPLSSSFAYEGFDALSSNTSGISNTLIESHISSLDAIMKGEIPCDVQTTFRTFDMAQSAARCFQDQNYLLSLSVNEIIKLMDYAIDHDAKNLITKLQSHLFHNIHVDTVIKLTNYSFRSDLSDLHRQCLSFLLDALRNRIPVYDLANLNETLKDQLATEAFRKHH